MGCCEVSQEGEMHGWTGESVGKGVDSKKMVDMEGFPTAFPTRFSTRPFDRVCLPLDSNPRFC
jgi:hypothetical protein